VGERAARMPLDQPEDSSCRIDHDGLRVPLFSAFEGAGMPWMLSLCARFGVLQAPLLLPLLGAKSAFEAFHWACLLHSPGSKLQCHSPSGSGPHHAHLFSLPHPGLLTPKPCSFCRLKQPRRIRTLYAEAGPAEYSHYHVSSGCFMQAMKTALTLNEVC